jgi:hypothetical protein
VSGVTEPRSRFGQGDHLAFYVLKWEAVMKKIFIILALAFAFTTGMAVVTVVAHTDQAAAAVIYPHAHPGLLIAKS